ncbi:MAG: 23S rRNA (uracil(1939)-C(5))-methyltransferase RlmD [Synergistaceae bacterium]|nr:23S rRNA (uracil(1939)-C(5))-methyltransferase RlmD [Synergistaceae bacterium]
MAARGDVVVIRTDRISSDGSSIGRLPDGGVVFVRKALPRETVKAKIIATKKSYSTATCVDVLEPHEERTTPFCPVYDRCGACQLQHASYPLQLKLKRSILEDAFRRICKRPFPPISPCVPSPDRTGYRNKTAQPIRMYRGRATMGYYARGSHDVVPMDSCPVSGPLIDNLFARASKILPTLGLEPYDERVERGLLRHAIFRQGINSPDSLVSLVLSRHPTQEERDVLRRVLLPSLMEAVPTLRSFTLNINTAPGNVILGPETYVLHGDGLLREVLPPFAFDYDSTSFFQVNTNQARALFEHAAYTCSTGGGEEVLELFSGVGALTAFIAERCARVTSVEEWPSAVEMMRKNMERNGLSDRVEVIEGEVGCVIPSLDGGFDSVVLDPPRTGCDADVLGAIIERRPDRVVYVSCNPATLARDAALLCDGGFLIEDLTCFDMFPQTVHVETVACFKRA